MSDQTFRSTPASITTLLQILMKPRMRDPLPRFLEAARELRTMCTQPRVNACDEMTAEDLCEELEALVTVAKGENGWIRDLLGGVIEESRSLPEAEKTIRTSLVECSVAAMQVAAYAADVTMALANDDYAAGRSVRRSDEADVVVNEFLKYGRENPGVTSYEICKRIAPELDKSPNAVWETVKKRLKLKGSRGRRPTETPADPPLPEPAPRQPPDVEEVEQKAKEYAFGTLRDELESNIRQFLEGEDIPQDKLYDILDRLLDEFDRRWG
jgi:hypothetical protein